jgi:hypothetical protein
MGPTRGIAFAHLFKNSNLALSEIGVWRSVIGDFLRFGPISFQKGLFDQTIRGAPN